MEFSRRQLLLGGAAAAGGLLTLGAAKTALAKAPFATAQAPLYYRLKVGTFEVTAFCDGAIDVALNLYPKAEKTEAEALLAKAHRSPAAVPTAINAYLVNTGEKLFLVDTGVGNLFGPGANLLHPALKAAGYAPEAIDAVILSHLHPDHIGGLADSGDKPSFPNATLLLNQLEYAFWTDEGIASRAPKEAQPFFKMAQSAMAAYKGRTEQFKGGDTLAPGVAAVGAYGHTPGHSIIDLTSGKDRLLIWVDVVHTAALQFAHPEWSISFDNDPEQAIATRKKIFDQVAQDGTLIAGMHLDFPGIGYVAAEKSGYSFQPAFYSPRT